MNIIPIRCTVTETPYQARHSRIGVGNQKQKASKARPRISFPTFQNVGSTYDIAYKKIKPKLAYSENTPKLGFIKRIFWIPIYIQDTNQPENSPEWILVNRRSLAKRTGFLMHDQKKALKEQSLQKTVQKHIDLACIHEMFVDDDTALFYANLAVVGKLRSYLYSLRTAIANGDEEKMIQLKQNLQNPALAYYIQQAQAPLYGISIDKIYQSILRKITAESLQPEDLDVFLQQLPIYPIDELNLDHKKLEFAKKIVITNNKIAYEASAHFLRVFFQYTVLRYDALPYDQIDLRVFHEDLNDKDESSHCFSLSDVTENCRTLRIFIAASPNIYAENLKESAQTNNLPEGSKSIQISYRDFEKMAKEKKFPEPLINEIFVEK